MARTKKSETTAAEIAQEALEPQETAQGGQPSAAQDVSAAAETAQDELPPQDPYEDLQEPDPIPDPASPLAEDVTYAVAGCSALNLRKRPGKDAPVIAELPKGVGVSFLGEAVSQADGHWWKVRTGVLEGWVMDEYLELLGLGAALACE